MQANIFSFPQQCNLIHYSACKLSSTRTVTMHAWYVIKSVLYKITKKKMSNWAKIDFMELIQNFADEDNFVTACIYVNE